MAYIKVARVICLLIVASVLVVPVVAAQTPPAIKRTVAPNIRPDSGTEMYKAYCAACHGLDGKGNGPAAPAMKVTPTDLTVLAKNYGGKFPTKDVEDVLRFGSPLASHGSPDMPTWGNTFRVMGDEAITKMRISNLIDHLQTLQVK
jgi:mono/diheme cytochrome c family protein